MNAEVQTPTWRFKRAPGRKPVITVSCRIPDDLLDRLSHYGNSKNLSMSETIRELLEVGLSA